MMILKNKTILGTALLTGVLVLAGCETTNGGDSAVQKGIFGALAGAAAGAIIGNNAGDGDAQSGALIGAVIGGAGGAYAGCREDGGCGATPKHQENRSSSYDYDYSRQQNLPAPVQAPISAPVQTQAINKRQYFDQATSRYYFYDPVTRQEFYENGERKYK